MQGHTASHNWIYKGLTTQETADSEFNSSLTVAGFHSVKEEKPV